MIKMCMLFIIGLNLSSPLFAALPPLYQTLNEYKALLTSKELTEKLTSADVIENIKRSATSFIITTNKHTLKVDIVYEPETLPGPSRYHLNFHEAIPFEEKNN